MTDAEGAVTGRRKRMTPLRLAVLVIAGLQTLLFVFIEMAALTRMGSSEALSRSIGQGLAILAALPFVLGTLPALVLGFMDRWLWVALALVAVAVPLAIFIFIRM